MIAAKAYAAQSATEPLAPFSFERRDLRPNDVHIKILFCGVCHSDIHTARAEWPGTIYPCVPGHEIVGKVVNVGPEVTRYKAGDTVGVGCLVDSCQTCKNCSNDLEQFCVEGMGGTYGASDRIDGTNNLGGYSSDIIVREEFVLKISDKQPLAAVAPLLCAGITTYSPLRHWKVGKGHKVGVVGLGGLGHMAVKLAVSMGAEVTMLSTSANKEADAKRLGAHKFALTKDADQLKGLNGYFNFIVNTVSADHDYNMYLSMLATDGVMICVGAPPTPLPVSSFNLIFGRHSLVGSLIGGIAETQEMLDYCAEHNIVSDIELINMQDINAAYDRVLKSDVRYRFVIDMSTLD